MRRGGVLLCGFTEAVSDAALSTLQRRFDEHQAALDSTRAMAADILEAASLLTECLRQGRVILLAGNGGSAADAQHLAGEWVGRFLKERRGFPAIALHTNSTVVTAVANDYGYDEVFARQVEAHGQSGDVLIALSTSGNSEGILRGARRARELGLTVIGMTGRTGGKLRHLCDLCLAVPHDDTPRIQEMHILIGHLLCELTENDLAD